MSRDTSNEELDAAAEALFAVLERNHVQVAFAESCTAGLVSASLGRIPGVSSYLSGSAVVYQEATKASWIKVSPGEIAEHGVVSEEVAYAMAGGVLGVTTQADFSGAVTGHLGPNAPSGYDGVVFVATAGRTPDREVDWSTVEVRRHELGRPNHDTDVRRWRQRSAAIEVLRAVTDRVERSTASGDSRRGSGPL